MNDLNANYFRTNNEMEESYIARSLQMRKGFFKTYDHIAYDYLQQIFKWKKMLYSRAWTLTRRLI